MLPPIRYPLPSLLALVVASLLVWKGAEWSKGWRSELAARARRALEGPPVPSSDRPQVVAGPITRRALLLHDRTPAAGRPGGPAVETIDRRMFVDIYDTWPMPGPATHFRVGNRRPIGWVPSADLLAWDTRLVVRAPGGRLDVANSPGGPTSTVEVGPVPLPVLAWRDGWAEVAVWGRAGPWSAVSGRAWVGADSLPPGSWGVWISQVELPILLRLALEGEPGEVRLRAVSGRLTDNRAWTAADLDAARRVLPPAVLAPEVAPGTAAGRLAEANSRPTADASWAGLTFRFLPLGDLP